VVGFVDGAEQGRFWLGIISQAKGNTVTKASADYVNGQLDYNRIRFGQFKDGLDEFYKNYKNKSILVDDAFGYVRDSIRGVDQTQLVQELETLRKQSVSSSHDSNK
jgi:chromosome condensin MukBEF MukE localization factor